MLIKNYELTLFLFISPSPLGRRPARIATRCRRVAESQMRVLSEISRLDFNG
jgi:hypothetical protein